MFDILVYVFQNYFQPDACPEPEQLARKLSAAGFEEDDISEAIAWLSALRDLADAGPPEIDCQSRSIRCFSAEEAGKLSPEARGFILFLENAGVISALTREMVIERAMALDRSVVSLAKLKVIALMVLWSRHETLDTLILDELLSEDEELPLH